MSTKPKNRRRSSSVTNALKQVPLNQQGGDSKAGTPPNGEVKPLSGGRPRRKPGDLPTIYQSYGFWKDLKTGRWMLVPLSSFKLLVIQYVAYLLIKLALPHLEALTGYSLFNPVERALFPQNCDANGRCGKSLWDFAFVFDHIIFWSFMRQFTTIHILRPLSFKLGVPKTKTMRFLEQGYAFVYFGIMGAIGVWVMKGLPTWWYRTEHMWLEYPHQSMTWELKTYYLLEGSYWLQQLLLLIGRIEKPRKDFKELVAHHFVTLWLIGWSYTLYLTYIGNLIYVSMDVSDIFLALAKCVNYFNENASVPLFAFFTVVWTYFRHYLNIVILWSVWTQFDLIPYNERQVFEPRNDKWMPPWMKYQIFIPILLLQFINLFWWFLIIRVLVRAVFTDTKKDERSDDEDEDDLEEEAKEKAE